VLYWLFGVVLAAVGLLVAANLIRRCSDATMQLRRTACGAS
jgi:intracellular septation protein A